MQGLPSIEAGHFLFVVTWALVGMCASAAAWSNWKTPVTKDYLAGSLGISMEALGVEIAGGHAALVVPLAASLFFALLIRYLGEERQLRMRIARPRLLPVLLSGAMVLGFFWTQVGVLLLAYRGWWDQLILYPGG